MDETFSFFENARLSWINCASCKNYRMKTTIAQFLVHLNEKRAFSNHTQWTFNYGFAVTSFGSHWELKMRHLIRTNEIFDKLFVVKVDERRWWKKVRKSHDVKNLIGQLVVHTVFVDTFFFSFSILYTRINPCASNVRKCHHNFYLKSWIWWSMSTC